MSEGGLLHGVKDQFKNQAYRVDTQVQGLHDGSLAEALRLKGIDYRGARATIEITQDNPDATSGRLLQPHGHGWA